MIPSITHRVRASFHWRHFNCALHSLIHAKAASALGFGLGHRCCCESCARSTCHTKSPSVSSNTLWAVALPGRASLTLSCAVVSGKRQSLCDRPVSLQSAVPVPFAIALTCPSPPTVHRCHRHHSVTRFVVAVCSPRRALVSRWQPLRSPRPLTDGLSTVA